MMVRQEQSVGPDRRALTVLIIDDHEDTRNLLGRVITRLGHRALRASCCAEARVMTAPRTTDVSGANARPSIDIVLGDVGLPDGDGIDLLREFKALLRCPTIALTGFDSDEDFNRAHHAGIDAQLVKPVPVSDLEALFARLGQRRLDTPL
jgi:DNA-binding response OmpR family regulator